MINNCIENERKPKKYKPWRLNDEILEDKSVNGGVESICEKINMYKEKYEKVWYDFFIKDITIFLKKKNTDFTEEKKKEQKILTTEEQAFIAKQQADKKAAKEYVATKIKPKKK